MRFSKMGMKKIAKNAARFSALRRLTPLALISLLLLIVACQSVARGSESAAPLPQSSTRASAQPSVQDFVRQSHIHGLPYAEAKGFTSADIPVLLSMLENPNESRAWPNIVGTLGAIGDEEVFDSLVAFMESGSGVLSATEYAAKTSVPMALGYLMFATDSDNAFQYLRDGLDPLTWTGRGISWRSPFSLTDQEELDQLLTVSVIGLALSGAPQAADELFSFEESQTGQREPFVSLLLDAFETHDTIFNRGLAEYYRLAGLN